MQYKLNIQKKPLKRNIKHSKCSQSMVHEEFHFRWLVFKALALSEVVHLRLTSVLPKKLLKRLKIYSKISFGTVHLQKLNKVLYVILSIR